MGIPYVISAELDLPIADLDEVVKKVSIDGFRAGLDANLRAMGKETLWLPSAVIKDGIRQNIGNTNLPIVSLDDRYVTYADQYLGISRGVDELLNDEGYVARRGYPTIESQLSNVPNLGREIVLVDDVLFSGEMVSWLSDSLRPFDVSLGAVVVGIAIREGIEKLESQDIPVIAAEVFEEVDDEICERDFAFVPGSGRRIEASSANALYFDPEFGRPAQWASIEPECVDSFCKNNLARNIGLLQPDVPMKTVGQFIGYDATGDARCEITRRIGELS